MLVKAASHLVCPSCCGVKLRPALYVQLALRGQLLAALPLLRIGLGSELAVFVDLHPHAAIVADKVLAHGWRPPKRRLKLARVKVEKGAEEASESEETADDNGNKDDGHDEVDVEALV